MTANMFPSLTKAVVESLSTYGNLISNWDYGQDWPLLTVVKIKNIWFSKFRSHKKFKPTILNLSSLTEEDLALEPQTEVFLINHENQCSVSAAMSVGAGVNEASGKVAAKGDVVDKSAPVTLMKEFISREDLRKLFGKTTEMDRRFVDALKMKNGDKLAFVTQRVYNQNQVQVQSGAAHSGALGVKGFRFVDGSVECGMSGKTSFIMPENKTFAFGLQEMTLWGNILDFSGLVYLQTMECSLVAVDVLDLINELDKKTKVWESLAGCGRLLQSLTEILVDGSALILLEDALDRVIDDEYEPPEPGPVASFMDLLDVPSASKDLVEALHLLVCAFQDLPENVPAALTKCDPENLDAITGIMRRLQTEDPCVSEACFLMEKEELVWVGTFLSSGIDETSSDDTFAKLEALYISVKGIRLMHPKGHS